MRSRFAICTTTMALLLAACGTSTGDRIATGSGIGAGTGLIAGALLGGPVAGLLIGAAAGAAVGGVTSPAQVDLGKPIWK